MGKLNLIFVIFVLALLVDRPQRVDGLVFSFLTDFLKAFGEYMLGFVSSRVQGQLGGRLESLIFGNGNRDHINQLHQEILYRMDEFSNELSSSTLKIIDELSKVMGANSKMTTLLQSLMKEVNQVEAEEQQLRRIWEFQGDLNKKTIKDFVEDLIKPGMNSLPGVMERINAIVREKHVGGFDESLIVVFINYLNSLAIPKHCGTITAPRQVLYHLFTLLVETEMKAYYLMHTGYTMLQLLSPDLCSTDCYNGEKSMLNATFESHMANMLENFGHHFPLVSKFTYNCAPEQYVEGVNYARFAGVQPVYIYNIRDIFNHNYCGHRFDSKQTYQVRRQVSDVAKNLKKQCTGKLKECQPLPNGMSSMCLENNPQQEFVKYTMSKDKCQHAPLVPWLYDFRNCLFYSCICDQDDAHNYVFVGPIHVQNPEHVVTGVRLVLKNRVLYWQLQTGKPRTFGFIENKSMQWQPLPSVSMQQNASLFHRIDKSQSFIMRNLAVQTPYVLTGVQFVERTLENPKTKAYDLNLFGRQIDLMDGKLEYQTMKFIPYKLQFDRYRTNSRLALVNENREEEITVPSKDNYTIFVTLGHSSVKHDFGQFLVPFFDTRNVTPSIPMPLKGIALYHRTNGEYAGFIAPRLIAINPIKYLVDFLNRTTSQTETEQSTDEKIGDETMARNMAEFQKME